MAERVMRSFTTYALSGQARGVVLRLWDEEWVAARADAPPLRPPRAHEVAERVAARAGISVEAAIGTQQSSYTERLEGDRHA